MDLERKLLDLLAEHETLGNGKTRELLGWQEATYERIKESPLAMCLLTIRQYCLFRTLLHVLMTGKVRV